MLLVTAAAHPSPMKGVERLSEDLSPGSSAFTGNAATTDAHVMDHCEAYPHTVKVVLANCTCVTDRAFETLSHMYRLLLLDLSSTLITDAALAHLSSLVLLRDLRLAGCANVTDDGMRHLPASLLKLDASGCAALTDEGLRHLAAHCAKLQALNVGASTGIGDTGVLFISHLPSLHALTISGLPRLTDKALMHVGCLPGLLSLNVSGCAGITNAGLALLAAGAATQELLKLDVRGTGVTAEGLGAVARVRQVFHESRAPPKERVADKANPELIRFAARPELSDSQLVSKIAQRPNLRDLELVDCERITEAGIEGAALWDLTSLTRLDLTNSRCVGDGVVQGVVARLTGLQSLSLAGAAVSDAGVWALTALTNLTALDLSWASTVTNDGVAALAALSGLQMLNLAYLFRLTDEGLAPLAGLKALRALNLRGVTHVGAEGRAHVKHVKHIVTGELRRTVSQTMVAADPRLAETSFRALKGTSSEALRTELDARPSLQHLQLKGAPVDALVLAHVARLVALRSLDLSGSEIDDGGVGRLCADLPGLRKVQLAGCAGVGDAACRHLVQLAELEELSLNGCAGVGDAGAAVLSRANELRALDLGGTQVTDEGLQHLLRAKALQKLSVKGCAGVTAKGRAALAAAKHIQEPCTACSVQ